MVLGGARSGKSTFAEALAHRLSEQRALPVTYIATAQRSDREMEQRIALHQNRRPDTWTTVEEPLNAANWIAQQTQPQVVLLDCLSLLVNNWMFLEQCSEASFFARMDQLTQTLTQSTGPIVVVSNEVGQGIVPNDPLTRQYRDYLGLLNQAVAKVSDSVIWVVAGIPVDLRKIQVPWP